MQKMLRIRWKNPLPPWYQKHPFPPDKKRPMHITKDKMLDWATGDWDIKKLKGINMYACTDTMLVSFSSLPPGTKSKEKIKWSADSHPGDQIFYVVKGKLSIYDPETGTLLEAKAGGCIYVPQGVWHSLFNLEEEPADVLTINTPAMCNLDEGPSGGYPDEPEMFGE